MPLPLCGLSPTDGPVLRLLIAFVQSASFARFNVSSTAEITINVILRSLWAFWSDIHGIPTDAYTQFCDRLKSLMPSHRPDRGDVTLELAGLVAWLKNELGAVSGSRRSRSLLLLTKLRACWNTDPLATPKFKTPCSSCTECGWYYLAGLPPIHATRTVTTCIAITGSVAPTE